MCYVLLSCKGQVIPRFSGVSYPRKLFASRRLPSRRCRAVSGHRLSCLPAPSFTSSGDCLPGSTGFVVGPVSSIHSFHILRPATAFPVVPYPRKLCFSATAFPAVLCCAASPRRPRFVHEDRQSDTSLPFPAFVGRQSPRTREIAGPTRYLPR